MEYMRLIIDGLDTERYEPLVAVRPDDGDQTRVLVERTEARPCPLPMSRSVAGVRTLCRAEGIDIVHIQTPATGGVPRMALGARLGGAGATLVTYHLVQPSRLGQRGRLVNLVVQQFLVDRTIAVSGGVAASLASNCGLNRRHIAVIHNGVEPYNNRAVPSVPLARSSDEVWIGYFGRLADEKGVRYLVDALALLASRYPHVHTVLVGDGYEREALETKVQQLGLSAHVTFAGYRADARALMREVDVVVLPSLTEGLPLVLAEAMEAGRPVVATLLPGVTTEVVEDGVTGLLVPPADPQSLSNALGILIGDPERRAALGTNGRERFLQHFQSRQMAASVYALYDAARRA